MSDKPNDSPKTKSTEPQTKSDGSSRRQFLHKAGKTAAYVAPVVFTLATPKSAYAASSS